MNELPMYIVYDCDPAEGALLVFAPNRQEARVLGYHDSWLADAEFIDVRARRIPEGDTTAHLRAAAESSAPRVIDDPPSCPSCGMWGPRTAEDECSTCAETIW